MEYQGIKELAIENDNLIKQVRKLEAQIEKMKCCSNCSHLKTDNHFLYPVKICEIKYPNKCENKDKWELAND
jgi:hypothetical protein